MNILENKFYSEESVFKPENLLREAKRQKRLSDCNIPKVCLLDPDGDILEYLLKTNKTSINKCWACYHTKLYTFNLDEIEFGIIACAVGASFAVLIAEQLFVSGCELLISITSSGIINPSAQNVGYILIENAIRDEGTSYHYLGPLEVASADQEIISILSEDFLKQAKNVTIGQSWTTDAPYRETTSAIQNMKLKNVSVVEMEAAGLYAFAKAKNKKIVCYAHITNSMAQTEKDFEKGLENGSVTSLQIAYKTVQHLKDYMQWK
jgi:purine-nucleoside phosphorylase